MDTKTVSANGQRAWDESRPALYVGTYAKYNNGSIEGAWLCLDDYSSREEFLEACADLHKDESDPEFMFQDFMNFPRSLYSECSASDELFAWVALDADDQEMFAAYIDAGGDGEPSDIESIRDKFRGVYPSVADYVEEYFRECKGFQESDHWFHPSNFIDWDRMAENLEISGDIRTSKQDDGVYIFDSH